MQFEIGRLKFEMDDLRWNRVGWSVRGSGPTEHLDERNDTCAADAARSTLHITLQQSMRQQGQGLLSGTHRERGRVQSATVVVLLGERALDDRALELDETAMGSGAIPPGSSASTPFGEGALEPCRLAARPTATSGSEMSEALRSGRCRWCAKGLQAKGSTGY